MEDASADQLGWCCNRTLLQLFRFTLFVYAFLIAWTLKLSSAREHTGVACLWSIKRTADVTEMGDALLMSLTEQELSHARTQTAFLERLWGTKHDNHKQGSTPKDEKAKYTFCMYCLLETTTRLWSAIAYWRENVQPCSRQQHNPKMTLKCQDPTTSCCERQASTDLLVSYEKLKHSHVAIKV